MRNFRIELTSEGVSILRGQEQGRLETYLQLVSIRVQYPLSPELGTCTTRDV